MNIFKGAIERNMEGYFCILLFRQLWTVLTLDTNIGTLGASTFLFIGLRLAWWTRNVGSTDYNITEPTFWLGMLGLVLSKWSTSDNDFGVTRCGAEGWRDTGHFNSRLSIFKELVVVLLTFSFFTSFTS
jgi:hypothetical protein